MNVSSNCRTTVKAAALLFLAIATTTFGHAQEPADEGQFRTEFLALNP
jgi:hypothetical protein